MVEHSGIRLFIGEDDFATDMAARKALEAFLPDESARVTALEVVNAGDAANADAQRACIREAEASALTPPFLDPKKATWWRNVGFLPGASGKKPLAQDVKEALEHFADELVRHPPQENQLVVISAPALLKTSLFAKKLAGVAEVVTFAALGKQADRAYAALQRVQEFAKSENLVFAPGMDAAFVAKAGTDTRTLYSELVKLSTYLGAEKRPVTRADIDAVTSPALGEETEIWAIQDAFAARNPAQLLQAVRTFQGDSGWAIMVTQVLLNFTREMVVARDQIDRNELPVAKTAWLAQRAQARARAFTLSAWRMARYRLLKLRERLVSSQASDAVVELELLRILQK